MSEGLPDLKSFAFFADFSDEDREVLLELLERKKISKGRKLFREGSEADSMILLTEGTLELSSSRTPHKALVGPGTTLGPVALMLVGTRELVARTLEPCELWMLPRESYRRLVDDHPRTACRLCEAIVIDQATNVREALDGLRDE